MSFFFTTVLRLLKFLERFHSYLESINDDVECVDDENMLEALYKFNSKAICHNDQDVFQEEDVSYLFEDEMDQQFESEVILHEIHEDLQPCQSIYSQRYEPNHSNFFSIYSFFEILCQEETAQDQVVENTWMKILNREVMGEESCLPRQELFSVENHNVDDEVIVHESSLLGKPKLHEEMNI